MIKACVVVDKCEKQKTDMEEEYPQNDRIISQSSQLVVNTKFLQ